MEPLLHSICWLCAPYFQCRLSFTFQITLSSRLIPVQKLWLLLCSIISHDFRLLQCMTAAQQLIRFNRKEWTGSNKVGLEVCWRCGREIEWETYRKQNFISIYWSSFASICPKIKNEENISFWISVESICSVSLNQWLYQSLLSRWKMKGVQTKTACQTLKWRRRIVHCQWKGVCDSLIMLMAGIHVHDHFGCHKKRNFSTCWKLKREH